MDTKLDVGQTPCSRRTLLLALAGAVTEVTGCGGGGLGIAGLSSGGTGSFTAGTITGLGSIIVNGIRYNDANAAVFATDNTAVANSSLQLGMVVSIQGSSIIPASSALGLPTAVATQISYASEWAGPVSNVSSALNTFEVLGNKVNVLASTIFSGAALKLADLTASQYVELYGYVDQTSGALQASRIEVSTSAPAAYRLSGTLTQVNAKSRTAMLGQTSLTWSDASLLPSGVSNNTFVRVKISPASMVANGASVWSVISFALLNSPLTGLSSSQDYEAEVAGSITSYQSTSSFSVNGIPVNAASAKISVTLAVGLQVNIQGTVQAGQLNATQVSVISTSTLDAQDYEFYGQISNVTGQTFVVHGTSFTYDANTVFNNVSLLQTKQSVQVKASLRNGVWYANEVDLED